MCFSDAVCKNIKVVGSHIIGLTTFWCTRYRNDSLLKLSLILLQNTDDLILHVQGKDNFPLTLDSIQDEEEGEVREVVMVPDTLLMSGIGIE
jgi:hypothetical protein